ncbi:TPA: hypothetical protein U2Q76_000371 [Acinetobacter baumannii]|nr:hypothetical protein [Acinetobacter baumannii]
MDLLNFDAYLIFACRLANDLDEEVDFICDEVKFVVQAASKANMHNFEEKYQQIKQAFPKFKIIMTHRPLFNLIETLDKYERLQAAMIADGDLLDGGPTGRIADAFRWEPKHDGARQRGHC